MLPRRHTVWRSMTGSAPISASQGAILAREDPLNVLRNHVDFQVHLISRPELREVGYLESLRDNRDLEIFISQIRDRQADAFDRNRSFEDQVTSDPLRISKTKRPRVAMVF